MGAPVDPHCTDKEDEVTELAEQVLRGRARINPSGSLIGVPTVSLCPAGPVPTLRSGGLRCEGWLWFVSGKCSHFTRHFRDCGYREGGKGTAWTVGLGLTGSKPRE